MKHKNFLPGIKICVVGLGYVGYPLLKLFTQEYNCVGFDINIERVTALINLNDVKGLVTSNWNDVENCNVYIVTVPTPTDNNNQPDTSALEDVCNGIGSILKKGDLIIFESTVYPGATDELCVPILENTSGLKLNNDFSVGYSPERINTGDKTHQIHNTPKIISASNDTALNIMNNLYGSVIEAKIIKASSVKVAEAAKMYENVQRDVLIALANQYADFCRIENIDVKEITTIASTKWNFQKIMPGLVGGHCIGVDPYYLLARANKKDLELPLVDCARKINELKAIQVSERILNYISKIAQNLEDIRVLILGFTYKRNTNDIRNTKIASIHTCLHEKIKTVDCYDPNANIEQVRNFYGINMIQSESLNLLSYDIIIKAVSHDVFETIELGNVHVIELVDFL